MDNNSIINLLTSKSIKQIPMINPTLANHFVLGYSFSIFSANSKSTLDFLNSKFSFSCCFSNSLSLFCSIFENPPCSKNLAVIPLDCIIELYSEISTIATSSYELPIFLKSKEISSIVKSLNNCSLIACAVKKLSSLFNTCLSISSKQFPVVNSFIVFIHYNFKTLSRPLFRGCKGFLRVNRAVVRKLAKHSKQAQRSFVLRIPTEYECNEC